MRTTQLLADLTLNGFTVSVKGDSLAVSPANRVNDRLLGLLKEHKPELIELLRQQPAANDAPAQNELRSITGESEPRRLWLVTLPSGERFSSSNTPPVTLAEMRQRYPGAAIEPEY